MNHTNSKGTKHPPPLTNEASSLQQQQQQPLFQRVDDPMKGRHLVATQRIHKGQLLFIERPLLAFQSIQNLHYNRYICYNCKAFVNTPANMLLWRCRSTETNETDTTTASQPLVPTDTTLQQQQQTVLPVETDVHCCIPCRHTCGYVYCSNQCEMKCWDKHHQYLCTGDKESDTHPIVLYKQYAIETNEVLLLIAEWWISQHTTSSCTNTNSNGDDNSSKRSMDEYTDFIMNPWWDVVTSDMIQDVNEPSAGYINGEVITIHDQLKVVCTTAAELLNQALGYITTTTTKNKNNNNNELHSNISNNHCIPQITALDIACRIGAMEQNAMGIRQRSPLCSPTILADTQFRHKYHKEYLQCLHETGFMGRNNIGCDDVNDDTDDNNEDVVAMNDDYNNNVYSYDDIARRLSKLYMNEDFSVNDTNPNGGNDTNTATTSSNITHMESIMYNTDGDDLDILFPPLDGTAMYSIACKMNHSCHPNVILLYRRRSNIGMDYPLVAMVVALRHIEPNEELTISYINANASYQQRQKDLQNYGFICHCEKCEQEKDTMVDDEESEDDDDDDDDDIEEDDMDDNDKTNSTPDYRELKLQERIERLDSIVNHSMFGRVPSNCYDPVLNYIVQTTNLLLSTNNHRNLLVLIHQSTTDEKTHVGSEMLIINLLESCVTAIQNHDYSLCKIVGCDLEATLLQQNVLVDTIPNLEHGVETKNWSTLAHREAYFCSALVSCIGYCHDYDFITAKHCIDRALKFGLPRQCVEEFVQYIETFASQMQSSV